MKVVSAKASGRYRIEMEFDDGTRGVVDLSDLTGRGVFESWEPEGCFEAVGVGAMGEVVWSCGIDLCPDSLYVRLTGKQPCEVLPGLAGQSRSA